jgi:hypothetical protein
MLYINSPSYKITTFIATLLIYALFLLLGIIDAVDRAAASLILIFGVYVAFRPNKFLHPANFIFANYLLYLLMPYSLFLVYREFEIEYILPWGMINDWSKVSSIALYHFELTFLLFFLSVTFFYSKLVRHRSLKVYTEVVYLYEISASAVMVLTGGVFIGCALFFNLTGGVSAWLSNYSETYITGKAGIGLLNYSLIILAHLLAFIAGWMKWRDSQRFSKLVWASIFVTLFACMFLQGIKSRIPLMLFFFLTPRLIFSELKLIRAIIYFFLLIIIFSIGMYFRSGGFYDTPRLAIEYLQSYFNTIFLHDIVLRNPAVDDSLGSMLRGFNKFRELVGEQVPREMYDLSVALTQIYFPGDWYNDGATQQWPIETDFYLSNSQPLFWIIPIFVYTFIISIIGKKAIQGAPFFLFLFGAELLRIMSIFRSGLLTWDLLILITYYFAIFVLCKAFVFRRKFIV